MARIMLTLCLVLVLSVPGITPSEPEADELAAPPSTASASATVAAVGFTTAASGVASGEDARPTGSESALWSFSGAEER